MNNKKKFWIGGYHAVLKAIQNKQRKILNLIVNSEEKKEEPNFENSTLKNNKFFNKIFDNTNFSHQGYAAEIESLNDHNIDFKSRNSKVENYIALDGVTDPRNIGSIIRCCVAFNFFHLIVNKKDFNEKSFAMYKAASGAMEKINLYQVSNIAHCVDFFKEKDFQIIGFDGHSDKDFYLHSWNKKNIIIFGSEGKGIKKLIKNNCDEVLKININSYIDSLNVANAAAAVLMKLKYTFKN